MNKFFPAYSTMKSNAFFDDTFENHAEKNPPFIARKLKIIFGFHHTKYGQKTEIFPKNIKNNFRPLVIFKVNSRSTIKSL